MGASLYWQPVDGKHLDIGLRSAFVTMFSDAFGSYPWTLTAEHINTLRGMKLATDQDMTAAALQELIEAIWEHNSVRVWPEY